MSFIVAPPLPDVVQELTTSIKQQMAQRTYRAANELRNSALDVLKGQRGGRRYKVPHTKRYYTASAPGEPPAVRTGTFRNSWQPSMEYSGSVFIGKIESTARTDNGRYILSDLLENGTSRMESRLHHDKIKEQAEPKIVRIYSEPFF